MVKTSIGKVFEIFRAGYESTELIIHFLTTFLYIDKLTLYTVYVV